MQVVLNKKSTKEMTLYSVGLYINVIFFFSFKKYALKNIAIVHVMCIFNKNITTHKVKNGISSN